MPMKRGSILAETVLVMPLLLLLIFGVIQFALIWTAKQMTAYAAFCATRAIMVVPSSGGEQRSAAQNAAEVALSWMCIADRGEARVDIPGWGAVPGSGTSASRVLTDVVLDGDGDSAASVTVRFRYPLLIPGMAVNKILANSQNAAVSTSGDFYAELDRAAGNPDTSIDGFWPWLEFTETCVLPMPYSTVNFPSGGFVGADIHGGGS